jgi:choline dehydrogenase-like flavoprotein
VANPRFDVCIVGSGPGGGIAAYVLAKHGLKVALIEAGQRLRPGVDYNSHFPYYSQLDARLSAGRSPYFRVTEFQERDHFTAVGDRPGHGLLKALGGRSLCWAGHSLRFGPHDFRDWPISYAEVAPYYAQAERLMCVSGFKDGLSNLPDGDFLPGVPMRCNERMLWRGVQRLKAKGRVMEFVAQRKAIPTVAGKGRVPCHYCGHCMAGCEVDSKYTSANTPIPLGLKTGNLTVHTGMMMTRIRMQQGGGRVAGITCVNAATNRDMEIDCAALVLACSAVETARHLLINGIANSSGLVGQGLNSHFGLSVNGVFPELRNRDASNDDGTDFYHSLLTGLYWDKPSTKFEGTYQVQCGGGLHPQRLPVRNIPGYGAAFKRELREINATHVSMNLQGMLLPTSKNFVDLDESRKDKFGLPLPRVHLQYSDSDVAMANDMIETCEEIIKVAGGRVISTPGKATAAKLQIDYNHWAGTVAMGKDPRKSVLNADGQSHDIPNLFVGDSSVFPKYPEKNPTLTNITLSWRVSDRLADKFKRGELKRA